MDKYRHYILTKENFNREWLICDSPINGDVIVWFGRTGSRLRKKVVKQNASSPHQEIERRIRDQEKDGYAHQGTVAMRDKRPVPLGNAEPDPDPAPEKALLYWRYEFDFSLFRDGWLDVNENLLNNNEVIYQDEHADICKIAYQNEPEIIIGKEFVGGEINPETNPVAFHMWLAFHKAYPFDIVLTMHDQVVSGSALQELPGFNQKVAEEVGLSLKKVSFAEHFKQQEVAYF